MEIQKKLLEEDRQLRRLDNIDEFKKYKCKTKEHKAGSRSVHYLVAVKTTKQEVIAEIQVRTIFEEAWSEIDHTIRYPHNQDNLLLNEFLAVFNRLAGSADEMGSYIRVLQGVLTANQNTQTEKELALSNQIKKLETQIKKLEIQATKRDALLASLSDIQQSNSILLGTSVGSLFNRGASLLDVVARPQEPTINYGSLVTISGSSSGLSALVKTGDKGSPAPFISLTTSKKSSD